jgi:hypothetical protein
MAVFRLAQFHLRQLGPGALVWSRLQKGWGQG